jgi:hypothetical protein
METFGADNMGLGGQTTTEQCFSDAADALLKVARIATSWGQPGDEAQAEEHQEARSESETGACRAPRGVLKHKLKYAASGQDDSIASSSPDSKKKSVAWDDDANALEYMTPYDKEHLEEWFYTDEDFEEFERDARGGSRKKRSGGGRRKKRQRPQAAPLQLACGSEGAENAPSQHLLEDVDAADASTTSKRRALGDADPYVADPLAAAAAAAAAAASGLASRRGGGATSASSSSSSASSDTTQSSLGWNPSMRAVSTHATTESGSMQALRTRREARMLAEINSLGIDALKAKIRQVAQTRRERLHANAGLA